MPIDSRIRELIKDNGHIKLDDMMHEALANNVDSYYRNIKEIGESGDFITAPEISQLFGEMIGLWVIEQWRNIGTPSSFNLVELGPGRGILMRDILSTLKYENKIFQAANICFLDINPNFIKAQKHQAEAFGKKAKWISQISDLHQAPTIVIANEFLDSLPIKQYIKIKELWYEVSVICDPSDGRIKFDRISVNKALQKQLMLEHKFAYDGAVIEESIKSLECIRDISSFLDENSGSALFIDYGYYINSKERRREQYNSTQQAIKSHQYVSVIDTLGESDLTAHVDFFAMRKASVEHPISQSMFSTQREFLLKYGIEIRHTQLKKDKIPTDQNILDRQLYRLIDNSQMGELFKVLELFSPSKIEGD